MITDSIHTADGNSRSSASPCKDGTKSIGSGVAAGGKHGLGDAVTGNCSKDHISMKDNRD